MRAVSTPRSLAALLARLRRDPRRWGAWLALAALVLGTGWVAGGWAQRHETEQRLAALRSAQELHALGLRGVIGKYGYLPAVVARQPAVRALLAQPGNPVLRDRVDEDLAEISRRADALAVYVMDPAGNALAASNAGTPESFVGRNYARRPYFTRALQGGTGLFYGVGLTTGHPGLFVAEAIRDQGQVRGVVIVKLSLDKVAATWARATDPVLLRDEHGVAFLATYPDWRYHTTRPLTPGDATALRDSEAYGHGAVLAPMPWDVRPATPAGAFVLHTRIGGRAHSFLALDQTLPDYGWTLTVMTDRDEILQVRDQAWAMAALLMALLVMAGLYWRLRERRYAEQRSARRELEQRVADRTRELQDAQAFRHAMEESLLVGMRARDMDGRIIYVNRALCQMTGYEPEELLGKRPPYPYWHPDDMEKHWSDSNASLAGRAERSGFESRVRHKAGHDVITRVYTAPLIDADGVQQGWMSSVVDITEQTCAEERQRAQEAQLQRAARLASLGEMASTLAHELNQPLMALSNFAAAAQALAEGGPPGLLVQSLQDIRAQAQRASEIVRRIRGMVRQGSGLAERFEVAEWVETVLAWLKPEIQARRVRIVLQLPPGLPALLADRVLAEQLLLNLVLNALQALDGQPPARRRIELSARVAGGRLVFSVADHGPGIAPEHAQRLFDPFFTTKADGLGLGLKICRSIAEAHGGALSWHPRPGGGAVFEFSLPLAP
ncbi:PAS domain S-box protein [Ideonella sp. B7]|uniref:ATP-binding protein n=1 Tax=Ideonella benzenivorans TaxID=2831643 RepID=UPI002872D85D|nr:ATP-binding protein [Ideonella benzenivorans]MCA6217146.1 PAS domain S-box protein [Ideonella benzenivorans]